MSPNPTGARLRGYWVTLAGPTEDGAFAAGPAFGRVHEDMLLQTPLSLAGYRQPHVLPAVALVVGDLPPDATAGLARTAVAGIFAAVELADRDPVRDGRRARGEAADDPRPASFLYGETLLPDSTFEEELRLTQDGRLLAAFRVADLGDPAALLAWLATAVGGLRAGQVAFLCAPAGPAAPTGGTLVMAGSRSSLLIARIGE